MDFTHRVVIHEEAETRLDRCLRLWSPSLTQGAIERAGRKSQLKINGQKAKPNTRVHEGDQVSFPSSFLSYEKLKPSSFPLLPLTREEKKNLQEMIIFHSEDIFVLNKPPGIAVQGGTKQKRALDEMMKLFDEQGQPRLVHRLDQDTSGLLVFARTLPMARWLTQAFKDRTVKKTYLALVCGIPSQQKGRISLALHKTQDRAGEKIRIAPEEGREAITHYQVLKTFGTKMALLELKPETGRMHQLRVHCASGLNTPIMGDGKYGGKSALAFNKGRLFLHAYTISLPSEKGEPLTFQAPLPKSFQEALDLESLDLKDISLHRLFSKTPHSFEPADEAKEL